AERVAAGRAGNHDLADAVEKDVHGMTERIVPRIGHPVGARQVAFGDVVDDVVSDAVLVDRAGVVDGHGAGPGAAVDTYQAVHVVHLAGHRAEIDRVGAGAQVDGKSGAVGETLDVHRIVAGAGGEVDAGDRIGIESGD